MILVLVQDVFEASSTPRANAWLRKAGVGSNTSYWPGQIPAMGVELLFVKVYARAINAGESK